MRYKIEYFRMKTDKWGHILPCEVYLEYANTLTEAENKAHEISLKFKKYSVNVYDLQGYGKVTWLVGGYEKGVYYKNDNYKR